MARRLRSQANSLYGTPQPLTSLDLIPVTFQRAPTTSDVGFTIGQLWWDSVGLVEYVLSSRSAGVATWTAIASNAGAVITMTGSAGGALSPAAGDMIIAAGTNIASTSGAGHTITINGSLTPTFTTVKSGKYQTVAGAGASSGIATLVAGTKIVTTTAVAAGSVILLTLNTLGGAATPQVLSAPSASIVAGTSFVINSPDGADTSTVNWLIVTPV